MQWMFNKNHKFNQDIENWDVSNVKNMEGMFYEAKKFNQNLGAWNLSKIEESMGDFMVSSGLSTSNYDKTLMGWINGNQKGGIWLEMGDVKYSKQAESARFELINKYSWYIEDGGLAE
jgi:surface protein